MLRELNDSRKNPRSYKVHTWFVLLLSMCRDLPYATNSLPSPASAVLSLLSNFLSHISRGTTTSSSLPWNSPWLVNSTMWVELELLLAWFALLIAGGKEFCTFATWVFRGRLAEYMHWIRASKQLAQPALSLSHLTLRCRHLAQAYWW